MALRRSEWPVIACQDAYRLLPFADVLYGCDARWWNAHRGTDFAGEKWSSHNKRDAADDKLEVAEKYGINLVKGKHGKGFSTDPEFIHYGDNSGFQAINLAIIMGATDIVLVGYDMRHVEGKSHFFGDHPPGLFQRNEYGSFTHHFEKAPAPNGVTIINATPDSALKCYPMESLEDCLYSDGSERYSRAG